MTSPSTQIYYQKRFSEVENKKRNEVWQVLCSSVLQKYVKRSDTVIDIAAGYCEFINNIKCGRKIAIDINPDVKKYAQKGIETYLVKATKIPAKLNGKIDIAFVSNFFEHLSTKEELLEILSKINYILKGGGKIIIMQPNINLVKEHYWDFIDHKLPLNSESLKEALSISGFKVEEFIERFLPYTTKGKLPAGVFFLKIYLSIPPTLRPFAGQSFIVAKKQ